VSRLIAWGLLTCWVIIGFILPLNLYFLPDADNMVRLLLQPDFLAQLLFHLSITFVRVVVGVIAALIIGLPLGILMARRSGVRELAEPAIDFVRGIPIAMLFPLFIIFVGLGEASRLAIVITLAMPIVALSVYISSRPNDDNAERLAYFGLRQPLLARATRVKMMLWEALPGVVTSVRLAISLGLVVVIVTEMYFVASSGIGWKAFRAYERFRLDELYVYVFVVGIVSSFLNRAVNWVNRRQS
jgi:ABC-type nitrate/sulfonate/bicarbonate transport system permease component